MEPNKHGQKWQEDVYWNCFKRQGFFASLSGGFHEQLAIPKKFAFKLRNKLPETATLKGPSGLTWSVELTRNGDALFFTNGWAEFVKDHSLEENDLLIFRFNGESSFNVWVYDPSNGTEKEALYFPAGSSSRDAAGPSDAQGQSKRKEKANFVVVKTSSEEDEGNASHGEKSENEESYKTPEKLGISSHWVKKHLSSEVRDVILRLKDNKEETWTVGLYLEESHRGLLTRNWKNFVVENGLEEDDVCVFNPGGRSHDQKFIIDVSIFRVVEKEVARQPGVN
ncbi:hypothetical protein COLO4_26418 [Corchorus olitorius]|uniref:TF-B3 domain-containing protein n=1 Tax=Corchorus olitorius TaxID=93759 RepID=A0A1R3HX49_9ROSI|nr:hypothetical protein COLO4_26418 [Corchorus olitorius]